MLLVDALTLIKRILKNNEVNQDYNWVTELADKYRKLITGVNIESLLIQFVQREDAELFAQRTRLTKAITPAVASSVQKPFNKVVRNDRVRKSIDVGNPSRQENIETMIKAFYGAKKKKNRGLDYWLKTRFLQLQFTDPNAWMVLEWATPATPAAVIEPKPFEVSAHMAKNWLIINDEVKWLQITQPIFFTKIIGAATDPTGNGKEVKEPGFRHTLYDEDVTVVYEQADPLYLQSINYKLGPNEAWDKIGDIDYLIKTFSPNIGYVPAFRLGYARDEATKGRTFVNPWHDALCYFEKSLKTVSEMDITMALHVFPQKLQYVNKCPGEVRNNRTIACNAGRLPDGNTCKNCKGSGYQIHTSAADAILLPMPDDKNEMLPLDQMIAYKAPPIETIRFQNEYILQLEKQVHQAVFNSQLFIKKQSAGGVGGAGGDVMQTATEADYNMESVYDALEPFTEKYSELWIDIVTTFAVLAGESNQDKIDIIHQFPAVPKLKTTDVLLSERKAAADTGAPSFLIETIDKDIADIIFTGDVLQLKKYSVKSRYFPYPGKTADEIALIISSQYVPQEYKVLYLNFDQIFKELEKEHPEIWGDILPAKMDTLVRDKVIEFILKLGAGAPSFNINDFRNSNPAGGDGTAGNNPGSSGSPGQQQAPAPGPGANSGN